MEELTKAEESRILSFKEQLGSIKRNITATNKELENLLVNKSLAETAFIMKQKTIASEIDKLNKEKESLVEFIESERKRLANEQELVEAGKKELEQKRTEQELELFSKQEKVDEDVSKQERILEILKNEIEQAQNDRKKAEALLLIASTQLESARAEARHVERESALQLKDLNKINKEREEAISITTKEINRLQKELSTAEEKVRKEVEKITIPKETIRLENEKLDYKRKQVEIIYRRTKRAWERLYPGQNLDNVIK